jgi:uncharacterized membrane protein
MAREPKKHVANRALLDALTEDGLLDRPAYVAAVEILRGARPWLQWSERLLLGLGTLLLLAGVVFFFAFNWQRLSPLEKLGAIQVGIMLALAITGWRGLDSGGGRAALGAAAVLCGVFLVVLSQLRQSGGDPWELFAFWGLLILPWILLARSPVLWILWWAIANLTIALFWSQVMVQSWADDALAPLAALAVFNALSLLVYERGNRQNLPELAAPWLRHLFLFVTLVCSTLPAGALIVQLGGPLHETSVIAALLLATIWIFGGRYYVRLEPNILAIGMGLFSICVVVLCLVARGLDELGGDDAASFLTFGVTVLIVMSAAAVLLTRIAAQLREPPMQPDMRTVPGVDRVESLDDLLLRLEQQGTLTAADRLPIVEYASRRQDATSGRLVGVFLGVGAWIAALCSIGFFGATGLLETEAARLSLGILLLVSAFFLQRLGGNPFVSQLGVAFALAGKICLVAAFADDIDEAAWSSLAVTALTYPLLRNPIDRFVSTAAALAVGAVWLTIEEQGFWLRAVVLLAISGATFLFTREPLRRHLRPLAYALIASAPVMLLVPVAPTVLLPGWFDFLPGASERALTAAFALLLIAACAWARGGWQRLLQAPGGLIVAAIAALALVSTPGILAALTLLVLAFARDDGPLSLLGLLYLGVFLVAYYYQLDVTLLAKSIILTASGVVLLVLFFVLRSSFNRTAVVR